MILGKYSFGIGDRFGHQGKAQLAALIEARRQGWDVTPVWNKSHREHSIIGTEPADVRREADAAVAACNWKEPYFVDADHIGLANVDAFTDGSDFFTLDVADEIGQPAEESLLDAFVAKHERLIGTLQMPGIPEALDVDRERFSEIAGQYLGAVAEAGRIYRHIEATKGPDNFVTEVSMDETDAPQGPIEMLVILAAIADEGIPARTIAPKFTGRFNKGVDYVGDAGVFAREFERDLAVIAYAVNEFGLPADLKLSVHSGSDKFCIYEPIRKLLHKHDAGLHLKTAGTTWLEEVIGLALAGGDALTLVKEIYAAALRRMDELCGPYATVIDIDKAALPGVEDVAAWNGPKLAETVRHDPSSAIYNPSVRQLLHVGYKIAAEFGPRFTQALEAHEEIIAEQVKANIYERHLKPLWIGA